MPARTALAWAVAEAVSRDDALRVAHVTRWPMAELDALRLPTAVRDAGHARQLAATLVAEAVEHARRMAPGIDVRGEALTGSAVELLAKVAADSSLLVVGASGQTANPQVLLGSSAAELIRRVSVPVAVVRAVAPGGRDRAVVVGVDGSPAGDPALQAAFDVAARHRHPLLAVHAWSDLPVEALGGPGDLDEHGARRDATALLADRLAAGRRQYPQVQVDTLVVLDRPANVLLRHADRAAMIVVGRHGRAGGSETPLGSVCHAVLHYAPCPVLLV